MLCLSIPPKVAQCQIIGNKKGKQTKLTLTFAFFVNLQTFKPVLLHAPIHPHDPPIYKPILNPNIPTPQLLANNRLQHQLKLQLRLPNLLVPKHLRPILQLPQRRLHSHNPLRLKRHLNVLLVPNRPLHPPRNNFNQIPNHQRKRNWGREREREVGDTSSLFPGFVNL